MHANKNNTQVYSSLSMLLRSYQLLRPLLQVCSFSWPFGLWNRSRNIIFATLVIFLQVTSPFILTELDPENITLATLVNFPTVRVWLDLRNITLVIFLSVKKVTYQWSSSIQFQLMMRSLGEEKWSTRYPVRYWLCRGQ